VGCDMKRLSLSLDLIFLVIASFTVAQSINTNVELIGDRDFSNGILLQGNGTYTTNPSIIDTLYPIGRSHSRPVWRLAQYWSRFDLRGLQPQTLNGGIAYANQGKRIAFLQVNGRTQINMEVFGSAEYLAPRKAAEGWPHLLLEQKFPKQVSIDKIDSLIFRIDARLMYCDNKMDSASYDPNLHTAQFSMYLIVQNLNPSSTDFRDYLWFGVHLYDYRYREIPEYGAEDTGKKDATRKFIYCPASKELYVGSFPDGEWIKVSKDLLPTIKRALQKAQSKGYLKGSSINDMSILGMNIGWEVTGTFDCGFQYKDLELTAIIRK